ncbi:ADP-ribosylation factor family/Ras of Complex, Roc, domain of DAPkinase/Ras family, putative [Angomonas deanei]|uniref:ADP-ribosylation factor family/Ras of Complex, Roc, domain of DAPkinase/Ras family, putative n=1 Tax=Angomonas deanei TaxID=59799 RepID=A0A7G2CUG7_9TRYP|nr:ADP-ribosylation factor family/Ras of Complex, Roc, domain of DAPkinase/Ras family, putative [Angomonas deanei]
MSTTDDAAETIKVIMGGESGVGKSSLLLSFTEGEFFPNIMPTVGSEFSYKNVAVTDKLSGKRETVRLQLWDTAGQERFRCMARSFFRCADAAVLLYDCSNRASFEAVKQWLDEIDAATGDGDSLSYLLVGNKIDLYEGQSFESMAVPKSEAQQFAQKHNMLFALTSAKTLNGVTEAFDEIARCAYDNIRAGKVGKHREGKTRSTTGLGSASGNSSGGTCC